MDIRTCPSCELRGTPRRMFNHLKDDHEWRMEDAVRFAFNENARKEWKVKGQMFCEVKGAVMQMEFCHEVFSATPRRGHENCKPYFGQ